MTIKALKKRLVASMGPSVAYWVIRVLGWTLRFEEVRAEIPARLREADTPAIGAFWHGRLLMMPLAYRGKKLAFLVSPHRDGQVVGRALERFGFRPIPGSTTRGGFSGFKGMLRAQREGYDVAVVPDGPRGPRCRVQIGVIELARLTGRSITPFSFGASRKKIFNTWDRFLLPLPFSRGVFVWGEPVEVDRDSDRERMEEKRQLLERRLNEVTEEADRHFDRS